MALASSLVGQDGPIPPVDVSWPEASFHAEAFDPGGRMPSEAPGVVGPSWAPLASLAVPGSGQFLQGRPWRGALFAAAEVTALWIWADARRDGERVREAYRDLAWEAARNRRGPRVVDDFDFYERMGFWSRSGRFDRDPDAPGVQPERDPDSWNGLQWTLAAGLHLGGDPDATPDHPGYGDALATYTRRAYDDDLSWDWGSRPALREEYRGLISESDDRYRTAGLFAGAILANHVLAGVEAFVVRRIRLSRLQVGMTPDRDGRAHFRIRILP